MLLSSISTAKLTHFGPHSLVNITEDIEDSCVSTAADRMGSGLRDLVELPKCLVIVQRRYPKLRSLADLVRLALYLTYKCTT
jgi:hypothetical protein